MFINGKVFANIQKVNVLNLLMYCLFIIEKYDKYVETTFESVYETREFKCLLICLPTFA